MPQPPGVNFQQPSVINNASYISSTEHMCGNGAFIGEGESRNLDTTVAYTENVSDCNDQQPAQDDEVDDENDSEEASPNLATGEMYYQPGDQMLWAQKPETVDMNALPRLSQDDLNILSRSGVGEMMTPGSHNRLSYVQMESAIEQYHFPQRDDHSEGVVEMDEEPLPRSFLASRDNDDNHDNHNNNHSNNHNRDDDNEDERPAIGAPCIAQDEWGKIDFVKQKALVDGDDVDTDTGDESETEHSLGKNENPRRNGNFYVVPDEKPATAMRR